MLSIASSFRRATAGAFRSMSTIRLEPCQGDSLTEIGRRPIFDSDHDLFRESARHFFETQVVPDHRKWEEDGQVPRELWNAAGEAGLLGLTVPEEFGGPGITDMLFPAIVWEEQAVSKCTGPGFALHSDIVVPYIVHYGSQEQKERYCPGLVDGSVVGAIAMTEPGAGSDLQGIRTTAKKDASGDYILSGSKTYITNGWHSDMSIVVAKTDASKGAHGISLFCVDTGLEGYQKGNKLKKVGMHAQDTCELFFDDVRLPASALLGEEGKGFYYLMQELPQERLLIAAMAISATEAIFEDTREWVTDRQAFGNPLVKLQTVAHKMAHLKTDLAVCRSFVDRTLELHKNGQLDSATASMAKYWATETQTRVTDRLLQLWGGLGFMASSDVARAFLDGRVQPIYGGSSEIMLELIARTIPKK